MKTYADLDLIKIRDECGLDFARHTYSKHQCSCCYGPLDMAAHWWAKGKKPKLISISERISKWDRNLDDISFILFKNAWNGSGYIKSLDEPIKDGTCISYRFNSDAQKQQVCTMLQEQLGADYTVVVPENNLTCIELKLNNA